jgi:hypothetical protein
MAAGTWGSCWAGIRDIIDIMSKISYSANMNHKVSEKEIRSTLLGTLRQECRGLVAEEVKLEGGTCIADVIAAGEHLAGYEIKSDFDRFDARLARQVQAYQRAFSRVYLVCGTKHLEEAHVFLPPWWGILVACRGSTGVELQCERVATSHDKLDRYSVASLLSKESGIDLLRSRHLACQRAASHSSIWQQVSRSLQLPDIERAVSESFSHPPAQSSIPWLFGSV